MHSTPLRLKFSNPIGGLALIEGTVKMIDDSLAIDMAMTESVTGAVDGVLSCNIKLEDLEVVEFRKKGLGKSIIEFTAYEVATFRRVPGSKGFKFSIFPVAKRKLVKSFVCEILFRMTELESKRLDDKYSSMENKQK